MCGKEKGGVGDPRALIPVEHDRIGAPIMFAGIPYGAMSLNPVMLN